MIYIPSIRDHEEVVSRYPGGNLERESAGAIGFQCLATDWSRDEKAPLVFVGNPCQIDLLDVASHWQTVMLRHRKYSLVDARFSPDNRWVSFTARIEPNRGWIMIAPVGGPMPVPESAWVKIAEDGAEDRANWSPDGKTLYFSSPRDGHHCLWAQRIDVRSHQPEGDAFAAEHLHGRASVEVGGWSAAGGRIAMVLSEATGGI